MCNFYDVLCSLSGPKRAIGGRIESDTSDVGKGGEGAGGGAGGDLGGSHARGLVLGRARGCVLSGLQRHRGCMPPSARCAKPGESCAQLSVVKFCNGFALLDWRQEYLREESHAHKAPCEDSQGNNLHQWFLRKSWCSHFHACVCSRKHEFCMKYIFEI